jgi:hypothetical protein
LIRFHVDQGYSASPGVAAVTNSFGVVAGRPPSITQHILLTVDAKDFSANPGDQVNRFKDALAKQDYFSHNLEATNSIKLVSESGLQSPGEGKPYVMFTLECRFADRTP